MNMLTKEEKRKMSPWRMSFRDYAICFLLAVIIFSVMRYEGRLNEMDTRLLDHKAFVDGLAGLNDNLKMEIAIEITDTVVDAILDDVKASEYIRGYDDAMKKANPDTINATVMEDWE